MWSLWSCNIMASYFWKYWLIEGWFNRYHCPDHVNPAEFLADLISIDYSSSESVSSSQKRIDGLVDSFSLQSSTILYATPITRREVSRSGMKLSKKTITKKKGGWWRQFWLLLKRAWMQVSLSLLLLINVSWHKVVSILNYYEGFWHWSSY